jgi:dTDP-4-dehydrorhamnose reductase
VLGANGMIGSTMYRILSQSPDLQVWGSLRVLLAGSTIAANKKESMVSGLDVRDMDSLLKLFCRIRPDIVVNCIGVTKHHPSADDPLVAIPLNSLYPHKLANLCSSVGSRLVHVSTDCVFAGSKGNYVETDPTDARDLYGKSKALGEVAYAHTITLRTSTIGHEICSKFGLLEWFLAQGERCKGYRRAIFSGLPSDEFARVVRDYVIPRGDLNGLYHVGGAPIDKYSLLRIIADQYGKDINIEKDEAFEIDRTLNSSLFTKATGYVPADWPKLIVNMHKNRK